VETAKATEELVSEDDAIIHRLVAENTECVFGQPVALLFDTEQERQDYLAAHVPEEAADGPGATGTDGLVLTHAAQLLVAEHGIPADRLRAMGKRVLKSADVERLIRDEGDGETTIALSRLQQAVSAVVSEAHRTIPAAFAAAKVGLAAFDAVQASRAADGAAPFGLVEVLAKAIAAQHVRFPLFFGTLQADHTVRIPAEPNVGVTIDVGKGLFIPVLRNAAQRSLDDLAGELMEFRIKAMRDQFRAGDFAAENITLSLHNEADIVLAAPIMHPGRVCVVTLCSRQEEVVLTAGQTPAARSYAAVSLTYDHRVINGRQAVTFLNELKRFLENAETIASLADGSEG
jgi:2-oxoglutarate dehydrogenase E2 component (dihydrolipoamide succinyltransferase)